MRQNGPGGRGDLLERADHGFDALPGEFMVRVLGTPVLQRDQALGRAAVALQFDEPFDGALRDFGRDAGGTARGFV